MQMDPMGNLWAALADAAIPTIAAVLVLAFWAAIYFLFLRNL